MASLFKWYIHQLQVRPLLANGIASGILCSTGDLIAQTCFPKPRSLAEADGVPSRYVRFFGPEGPELDIYRSARAIVYGGFFFLCLGYNWYKIIHKVNWPFGTRLPRRPDGSENMRWSDLFFRITVDQCVFAPVAVGCYFVVMSVLEQRDRASIWKKLRDNYGTTVLADWMLWPAVQFVNFGFVPLKYRLLVVNATATVWNTFLSYQNNKAALQLAAQHSQNASKESEDPSEKLPADQKAPLSISIEK